MKYLTFATTEKPGRPRPGALLNDTVIDLEAAGSWAQQARGMPAEEIPGSLYELIHSGPPGWFYAQNLINLLEGEDPRYLAGAQDRPVGIPLNEVVLYPPLPRPMSVRDFYAFEQHVSTARAVRGKQMPEEWYLFPVFYFSNPNAIFGPGETVPYPTYTQALDYELEAACVIGKPGKNIPAEAAEEYIFGYTLLNDWTARDVQQQEMKVGLGPAKGKDFATSLGPWIVTPAELADRSTGRPGVYDLAMTARVNGQVRSQGNWKDIFYSFGEMIARASQETWLLPGDVIGSGTVGSGCLLELTWGQGPWLQAGDLVELEIERLGVLANQVGRKEGEA